MIWNLNSAPALASLSNDEANLLVKDACASRSVRRASFLALFLCGVCCAAGSWISDLFSVGLYGGGIGGAVGGFVYSQVRARAILRWIEAQNKASPAGHGFPL